METNQLAAKIRMWYMERNQHHPTCDHDLYDIVINSLEQKISYDVFLRTGTDNQNVVNAYKRYEDLRSCLIHYVENNNKLS